MRRAWGVLIAAGALAVVAQMQADRYLFNGLSDWSGRCFLIVPSVDATKAVATGFEQVIADSFWLSFLQYNGEKVVTDRRFENLSPMLRFITDLDPRFCYVYQLGGWVLADAGNPDDAAKLLDLGYRKLPRVPEISFQQGFVEFLYRHDYLETARWFMISSGLPGASPKAKEMAAAMYSRVNKTDLAMATWLDILDHAKDAMTRRIAERAIARMVILQHFGLPWFLSLVS
jgi:hypothetical protein